VSLEAARARQLELSAEQRAAVEAPPGPLLILAGPGSGKTLTLTHRAAHLIATGRVRPEHLLAITFTNRAAEELAVRLRGLVGLDAAGLLTVGTFHAVCHRMLRPYAERVGRSGRFSIYDAADSRRLCQEALREEGIDERRPEELARAIALCKARLQNAGGARSGGRQGRASGGARLAPLRAPLGRVGRARLRGPDRLRRPSARRARALRTLSGPGLLRAHRPRLEGRRADEDPAGDSGRERDTGARSGLVTQRGQSRGRLSSSKRLRFDTSSARARTTT
jgi:UvrD/REP helicase N-terminal domain